MLMPPTRLPSGAPVPVGVAPTSSRRKAGGTKSMICQRSTCVVKPPTFTKVGGAGWSMIQRVTTTLFGARVTFTTACSASAALPIVVSCTKAKWVRSSRLSTTSCQFAFTCR